MNERPVLKLHVFKPGLEMRARQIADLGIGEARLSLPALREEIYKAALKALREVAGEARRAE